MEDVITAAFTAGRNNGLGDSTARRIAEEPKSSTAPVYPCFNSMDELKTEVMNRAEKLMIEYSMRPYTKSFFLNMGTGLILFSQTNRELFRSLLLESDKTRDLVKDYLKTVGDKMGGDVIEMAL